MFKKGVVSVIALVAFAVNIAYAEGSQEIRQQMKDLRAKQEQNRVDFEKAVQALDESTKEQLSKLDKGDRASRIRIKQERKTKLEELRENFRKGADSARAERDQIKEKIKAEKQTMPKKKHEAPVKAAAKQ